MALIALSITGGGIALSSVTTPAGAAPSRSRPLHSTIVRPSDSKLGQTCAYVSNLSQITPGGDDGYGTNIWVFTGLGGLAGLEGPITGGFTVSGPYWNYNANPTVVGLEALAGSPDAVAVYVKTSADITGYFTLYATCSS